MDVPAYTEHAAVLMMQAECATGQTRRECFEEATDMLLRAERLAPGSGSYQLACIHARQGNHTLCLRWLERARARHTLPPAAELRSAAFFAAVQAEPWFRQFLGSLQGRADYL